MTPTGEIVVVVLTLIAVGWMFRQMMKEDAE